MSAKFYPKLNILQLSAARKKCPRAQHELDAPIYNNSVASGKTPALVDLRSNLYLIQRFFCEPLEEAHEPEPLL